MACWRDAPERTITSGLWWQEWVAKRRIVNLFVFSIVNRRLHVFARSPVSELPRSGAPPGGAGWTRSKNKPVQFSPGWPLASTVRVCRMLADSCHVYVCIRLRRLAAWNPPQSGVLWRGGLHIKEVSSVIFCRCTCHECDIWRFIAPFIPNGSLIITCVCLLPLCLSAMW